MLEAVDAKRLTAEDVLRAGSAWGDAELWDGLPLVREPSGGRAELVAGRILVPLGVHVRERGLGWVFPSGQGFLVARDPDRLLAADGSYVSKARLPVVPARGFVPLAPDFAVEVRSPGDAWEATVEKCGRWIAHGTSVAWAVDPDARKVAVFRAGRAPEVLEGEGAASGRPALPDLHVDLADLFADL